MSDHAEPYHACQVARSALGTRWVARCSCGWHSTRASIVDAAEDAERHELDHSDEPAPVR